MNRKYIPGISFQGVVEKSKHSAAALSLAALFLLLLAGRGSGAFPADAAPVLAGAGDIAGCGSEQDEATARLLDDIPGTVVTLGDNVYPDGTAGQFGECYGPTWGRHTARTRPAAGNHEYHTANAAAYFDYFGAAAGGPGQGYYSYDLAGWHIIALNSECAQVGGCGRGSAQGQWLQADLAAHPSACILAYWHRPLFSSGLFHGGTSQVRDFWKLLYAAGAEVVLNGHEHSYERFAPQDPSGRADPAYGIRQLVVGTGGSDLYPFGLRRLNSEVRQNTAHGVLKITLDPGGYAWEFIPVAGETFRDQGRGSCTTEPNPIPDAENVFMPMITR